MQAPMRPRNAGRRDPQREALAPRPAHKAARFLQHPQRSPAAAPGGCPGLSAGPGGLTANGTNSQRFGLR
jgi:hypothetical protein